MGKYTPIPNHKQQCRAIAPRDWDYIGFFDGFYNFQKGAYTAQGGKFFLMRCREEDLSKKNLAFMAKHNLSRMESMRHK